jgi:hypothetical protein
MPLLRKLMVSNAPFASEEIETPRILVVVGALKLASRIFCDLRVNSLRLFEPEVLTKESLTHHGINVPGSIHAAYAE